MYSCTSICIIMFRLGWSCDATGNCTFLERDKHCKINDICLCRARGKRLEYYS